MTRRAKPVIVFNVRILKSDGKTKVKCSFTAFEKDATKPIKVGQRLTVVGEFIEPRHRRRGRVVILPAADNSVTSPSGGVWIRNRCRTDQPGRTLLGPIYRPGGQPLLESPESPVCRSYLVFLDESGFFLTPTVRRTMAPRGKTPVLEAWDRRDRWSAISCITISPVARRPGLHFDLHDHNIHGEDVVEFLKELHRRLGRVTVIWDRNKIHSKSKVVKAWLAQHPEVVAEDFPGYVPDLNPDEGVWGWTKYGQLANLAANDKEELWDWVLEELVTVKYRPDLLNAFIQQTGLPGVALAV